MIFVCNLCLSPEIEKTMWVKVNTLEPVNDAHRIDDTDFWCPVCERHVDSTIKPFTLDWWEQVRLVAVDYKERSSTQQYKDEYEVLEKYCNTRIKKYELEQN